MSHRTVQLRNNFEEILSEANNNLKNNNKIIIKKQTKSEWSQPASKAVPTDNTLIRSFPCVNPNVASQILLFGKHPTTKIAAARKVRAMVTVRVCMANCCTWAVRNEPSAWHQPTSCQTFFSFHLSEQFLYIVRWLLMILKTNPTNTNKIITG